MTRLQKILTHPLLVLALVFVVLPWGMTLAGSTLSLATQVVIYALYGIAYNLLLGYTGMVSFGSSVFFGMASYASALFVLHVSQNLILGLMAGTLFAALLGLVIGLLVLRRRGLYFALLTLAFTQLFYEISFRWTSVTGGENGLQGITRGALEGAWAYYGFCAVVVVICAALLYRVAHSPFGRVLQAIRDNEKRVQYLGYDPWGYKLSAMVIHAAFIGLGGSLLSFLIHGVYADNLNWQHAGDPIMMTLLGGIHHFLGPLWGAIIYINLSDQLSAFTEHWWLFFGALIIAVVLLSPEGLSGLYRRLRGTRGWGLTRADTPPMPAQLTDPFANDRGHAKDDVILEIRHLSKRFGHVVTADDISLTVRAGTIHSIIGPNGAGKTTLFNMLTGLIPSDGGEVRFKDQDITRLAIHERARLGISRSFQIVSLPANLTVLEAVRVATQARSPLRASLWRDAYDLKEPLNRAWALLQAVGLETKAGEVITNLPHGEQRLLDIAVTMATGAELLLLDEPLAGLADADRERISTLIRKLAGQYTILLIEHDIDRVIALSDRMTVLHQGHLIADGDPDAVVSSPQVVEAYLGEPSDAQEAAPLAGIGVGKGADASAQPILRMENVAAGYSGSHVLNQLSLEVRKGEAVALLGRNGVGKTTTLHTIMGLVSASEGQIHFNGTDIAGWAPNQVNRQGLAIVPQGRRIFPNLTVTDNLLIAQRPGGWTLEKVFQLFPKLATLQDSLGGNLSGGELQMLAIARALMAPAQLILLDEPFEGLAPAIVNEVLEAVIELRNHTSILIVEQRVDIALRMVDRAYIMVNGQIAFEGTAAKLKENKELQVKLLGV